MPGRVSIAAGPWRALPASRLPGRIAARTAISDGGAMRNSKLLLALLVSGAAAVAQAQAPIKIGFMAELSGPQGALGQDQYDAFMMVVEQNGGRLGGVPVEVIREDSQLKPEVATKIVDKEVFLIGSNAGPAPIAGAQCSPYSFITSWQNDNQAEVVGVYANDKGYKKVIGMAPNYQAGKDFIAGFKRLYKGEVIDEIYTPLNQPDFSAELAQVAAKKPDAVYVFYPGGLGVNFVRQYKQAGLMGKVPLLSTSTTDGSTLPAQKDDALGVISGTFWGPDFNNPVNKKFVEDFEKKYNRIPSQYAAQSYDAALLLDSAIGKVKGNVADKKAFMAALKAADFKSLRGDFRFNNNNFPIQDQHVFEVAKDAKGRVSLKTIGTPLKNHQDAYHAQCTLK